MPLQQDRTEAGQDGTARKAHYGDGRQPWDDMVDLGWAPYFAAASILKYVRRAKDPEHSLESARWYYAQLYKYATQEIQDHRADFRHWSHCLKGLEGILTQDELVRLRCETS